MKTKIANLLILSCTFLTASAQLDVPLEVTGSFFVEHWMDRATLYPIASNPDFNGPISGTFSFSVTASIHGTFTENELALDFFSLEPASFGYTTFTLQNVGADVTFFDGRLQSLIIGGLRGGVNAMSGNVSAAAVEMALAQ